MPRWPAISDSKWIQRPSVDQRGIVVYGAILVPPVEVHCRAFDPSLSDSQISYRPERFEVNAIRLPSGENAGVSSTRVDEISLTRGFPAARPPFSSRRKMSVSKGGVRPKASRPCRDITGQRAPSPA